MGGISYKLETAIDKGVATPGKNVIVKVKSWKQSTTIILNGSLLVAATLIKLVDVLTGNNALEPIVKVFVEDSESVASTITAITQFYTALNLYLRAFKTSQPISR